MSPSSAKPRGVFQPCGFHDSGRDAYMDEYAGERLRAEKMKLRDRVETFCHPKGLLGRFALVSRRRRLLRKLRERFEVPHAMFLTQEITCEGKANEREDR